jgi:hypothetical protein
MKMEDLQFLGPTRYRGEFPCRLDLRPTAL